MYYGGEPVEWTDSPPLPHAARYVAVFGSMGAVVFFNGAGYERALWRALAGGDLSGGGGAGKRPLGAAEKKAGRGSRDAAATPSSSPSPSPPQSSHAAPQQQPTDDVRLFVCPELRSPLRLNARLPSTAIEGGAVIGRNSGSNRTGGIDALLLRAARPAVVQTVACVAAQSVALHHYESRVDAELASFRSACAGMAATGSFRQGTPKEDLLRAVAANNVMLAAIMGGGSGSGASGGGGGNSSLDGGNGDDDFASSSSFNSTGGAIGVMSRLDVAWEDGEAAAVYEHLREDHEFALRLQNLELKLGFVQENLKYFLELMQARKSDTLEWTIIVLIAAEIGVSLFDMWSKAEGAAAAVVAGGGGGVL